MSWFRALGDTGIQVSAIGLGTVKLGRDRGVRYAQPFTLPDARSAAALLSRARELGVNLIDTAPAYGDSEQRLGQLLKGQRQHWVLCSKVGETFIEGKSHFDFSPEHTRASVERSLLRLGTDILDVVLVHSNGDDLDIIERLGTLDALQALKREGLVRAIGMSTKTIPGGIAAAQVCDVLMLTYNLQQREERAVLDACQRLGRAALVKKALAAGHLAGGKTDQLQASMDLVLSHPGTTTAVIGTINPRHLEADVKAARRTVR